MGASHKESKYLIRSCLKSQNLPSIDYVSLVKTAVSSIVLRVDFSDLLICCRNIDLLKKHKEIVRLRPFFQLNHARKSSSNVRITSNFFIRFRKYLLSKALPPACSRVVVVELHQAICSKMHSYVLFFGNAFILIL